MCIALLKSSMIWGLIGEKKKKKKKKAVTTTYCDKDCCTERVL